MNEFLKSFTSKNFLWGLGVGVISYALLPVIKDSLKSTSAGSLGAGAAAIAAGSDGGTNNSELNYNYDLLAQELRNQREYTLQQLGEITRQLASLQKEINTIRG